MPSEESKDRATMMLLLLAEHSTHAPASKAGRKDDQPSTQTHSLTGPEYDSAWYSSPLDDPSVGLRKNYHQKRVALRSLKCAKHRIDHDIAKLAAFLTESGHMDSSSEDGDDADPENVFAVFELMKVGKEDELEDEEEGEGGRG
ncbi:hypothetical protein PENFLA_c008G05266 [Penicillium flavigenum]|uniref:Uncharacterized protein n=1 Tax=Penicillium flavigenum TaxID=254877 RepID=A0A1V6THZ3_9EURO|nr:hypothetical protein PENFLA_c008G05266 [Penicillium flavigenum]